MPLAVCLAAACAGERETDTLASDEPRLVNRVHATMGTELSLTAWTADEPAAVDAFQEVFHEFDRLDKLMSVWQEGSDVLRLNAEAGHSAVPLSADTLEVLSVARQISEWTNGKFDVTFGALSGYWKFDHDQDNSIPDMSIVRGLLPLVDYRALVVDESARTGFLKVKGMRVHLGGIGKGYAIDRGAEILKRRGLRNFMMRSGGDLYVAGQRGDRPWRLGIRDPRGPEDRSFAAIELSDATFSTSGDYERAFVKNGRRYHHILDPDIGEPARGSRSVTIVANRAVLADGLSTGVFVLGPDAGMALVERLPDVEGVIVTDSNAVLVSSGLRDRLVHLTPPTDAP